MLNYVSNIKISDKLYCVNIFYIIYLYLHAYFFYSSIFVWMLSNSAILKVNYYLLFIYILLRNINFVILLCLPSNPKRNPNRKPNPQIPNLKTPNPKTPNPKKIPQCLTKIQTTNKNLNQKKYIRQYFKIPLTIECTILYIIYR